jgi:hypothetical protein
LLLAVVVAVSLEGQDGCSWDLRRLDAAYFTMNGVISVAMACFVLPAFVA